MIRYFLLLFLVLYCRAECNGGASLCQRRYNEITHLVTHDSYAMSPNLAATQDDSIVDQLNNGVRGIKLSAVPSLGDPEEIHLCHTFCGILDAGPVTTTLNKIAQWLDANPKEVITIMWNNLYSLDVDKIARTYETSAIMRYLYTHTTDETWPTLQELIDRNQRVVNFIDAKANKGRAPWLMDQFVHVFETPYDNTDINHFNCTIDRISPDMKADNLMYVLNHFLYGVIDMGSFKIEIPYKEKAHATNSYRSLSEHAQNCTAVFNKKQPTFVEVDFYLTGDAIQVVSALNQVQPPDNVKTSNVVSFEKVKKKLEHIIIENAASSTVLSYSALLVSVVVVSLLVLVY